MIIPIPIPSGGLSKPANTLIERISDALGGLAAPWQIRRVARAEADARVTAAEADLKIKTLHGRALLRMQQEQALHQINIESIVEQAIPLLEENSAKPESIENDWLINFFDKCRLVTDKEMQNLWARVLAGESNTPGRFSKRTLATLSSLDNFEARSFESLCRFSVKTIKTKPSYQFLPIFNLSDNLFAKYGLNLNTFEILESIGIIKICAETSYINPVLRKTGVFLYANKFISLSASETDTNFRMGKIRFTEVGLQLSSLCIAPSVDEFLNYLLDNWKDFTPEIHDLPPA